MTEKKTIEQKIKQINDDMARKSKKAERYVHYGLVALIAGGVMHYGMHLIFDLSVEDWLKDTKAQFLRELWNVLMYVIPWTFWAIGAGFWGTCLLVDLGTILGGYTKIFLLKRRVHREGEKRNVSH